MSLEMEAARYIRPHVALMSLALLHPVMAIIACVIFARAYPAQVVFTLAYAFAIVVVPFASLAQAVNWATPEEDETPQQRWVRKWLWLNVMIASLCFYLASDWFRSVS